MYQYFNNDVIAIPELIYDMLDIVDTKFNLFFLFDKKIRLKLLINRVIMIRT